jgi:hypothetical protein
MSIMRPEGQPIVGSGWGTEGKGLGGSCLTFQEVSVIGKDRKHFNLQNAELHIG